MKLIHWPLMGGLLHLVQRGGNWVGPQASQPPPSPAVPNATAHPSMASVPITVLLYCCAVLMWVGCYIWYSEEGTGRDPSQPRPLLAVPTVTAHPSTASVPITVLLYNSTLLCSFNVGIKGLSKSLSSVFCGPI